MLIGPTIMSAISVIAVYITNTMMWYKNRRIMYIP